MDHNQTRRSIGVLARFHGSSWSTVSALSLTEQSSSPRVLLLCDDENISAGSAIAGIRPCWNFCSNDLTRIEKVIAAESINVIHLNDPWLLTEWAIAVPLLENFRKRGGITTVALPYPQRRFHDLELIARCFDQIIVATEQDRIWLSAQGLDISRLVLNQPAGPRISAKSMSASSERNVVIVASHQIENQIADLLRNLHEVESGERPLNLTFLASGFETERNAAHYARLRSLIERSGAAANSISIKAAATNKELLETLAAADVVAMPELSGSTEQMAAVTCALATPAVLISTGVRQAVEAGAALPISSEEPLWRAIRLVFDRSDIRQMLLEWSDRWRTVLGPEGGRTGLLRLFEGLSLASMMTPAQIEEPCCSAVGVESAPHLGAPAQTAAPAQLPSAVEPPKPIQPARAERPAATPPSAQSSLERALASISAVAAKEKQLQPASGQQSSTPAPTASVPSDSQPNPKAGGLRILMQNRPNMFSQRGGDTVVVEQLAEKLREFGATVDIDLEGKADLKKYDLVHLHNFAIREVTENFARRAVEAGVPYVVTTLYEDWPRFFNQMMATYSALELYIRHNQPRDRWNALMQAIEDVPPSSCWDNTFAATNAASLFVSGANEADALRRDYRNIKRIDLHNFGCHAAEDGDGGELFTRQTGLRDFVFCVGRLETRKNQLMLLRALEDSELTVVFASGGFTYQKEYADACRSFRRRGKTVFLDRLDPKMLASAYGACRIHALPSWYELPGLVSIEAARYGAGVVASEYGTSRDYLGDFAHYCRPSNPESILQAVETAYRTPVDPLFKEHVKTFTWNRCARQVLAVYNQILLKKAKESDLLLEEMAPIHTVVGLRNAQITTDQAQQSVTSLQKSLPAYRAVIDPECLETDKLVRAGKFEEAKANYEKLISQNRSPAAASRGLGVIELLAKKNLEAEKLFRQALRYDPEDFRALAGIGTALWEQGRRDEGFDCLEKAVDGAPDDQSIVLQLINPSYALDRLEKLQFALERFVRLHPDNLDMCYCLAGCYFRRKRFGQAEGMLHRILLINPTHPGGLELRIMMQNESENPSAGAAEPLSAKVVSERIIPGSSSDSPETGRVHGLPGKPPEINSEQLIFQAEQAKKAQDFDQAISVAQTILMRSDNTENQRALAWVIIGEALGCKGALGAAETELRKAESNLAHGYRALSGLGAIAAANENYEEAEKLFRRSLSFVRENDNALAGLGICAMKRNLAQDGWDYFKKALEINPENMRAICGLIQLATPLNRLAELEKALETYLEFRPVELSVLFSYAGCLFVQGKRSLASEQLRKILVFDPEHKLANDLLKQIDEQAASSTSPAAPF